MKRAFSLVEVLLAILILALGLLGLGAVIPVIVKQQRTATDNTLGVAAVKAAQAYIHSRPEFNAASTSPNNAWDLWLDDQFWSRAGNTPTDHLWEPWKDRGPNTLDFDDGTLYFTDTTFDPPRLVTVLLDDRLWPGDSTQPMRFQNPGEDMFRPQFVWDMVGRRLATGPSEPRAVQVAIFVRRIDLNIRVPRGGSMTLRDVLTNPGLPSPDRCVPVAVVSANDPTPTNRGNNGPGSRRYANFFSLDATFNVARRDRIALSASTAIASNENPETLLALASQPNQKLVDNFGNVYTVLRTVDDASTGGVVTVEVHPQVPTSVPDPASTVPPVSERFRQVIFTPQVAGAVQVFTVTRPVK